jgi:hypothetical protein
MNQLPHRRMPLKHQNLRLISPQGAEKCPKVHSKRGQFQKGNVYAWSPGQSGNPAGRPKQTTLGAAMRRKLAEVDASDPERRTHAELIAAHLVRVAAGSTGSGRLSVLAARELADRTEGKPRQAMPLPDTEELQQMLANFLGCSVDELPLPEDF